MTALELPDGELGGVVAWWSILHVPPEVLPVVQFGPSTSGWKFRAVGRFAAGRPLAWPDDDFDLYPRERDAFLDRREEGTELVRVDPRTPA
jgi:hypothetical protein